MQSLFRLRIDADEALQSQRLLFADDGAPERESSVAVVVQWSDRVWKPVLEPVFEEFVRDYRESGSIVSPGSFLEKLVHALDAACNRVDAAVLDRMDFAVALCCGRGLYLLHSIGFAATCALEDGVHQPLVSSLRVRVKDLSPSSMRGSHLWNPALVDRLRLVRVFFEDEDAATVRLVLPAGEVPAALDEPAAPAAEVIVTIDKEPALETVLEASGGGMDAGWPDLDAASRRDRRTLSYAAIGLVALLFGTALVGMWRWHRLGTAATTPGAETLFSETVDRSLDARVSPEIVDKPSGAQAAATGTAAAEPGALDVLWSKRHSDWVTSSPRLARGRVVYGCRDGHLYSVEPDGDGDVVWDYDSGAGIGATPAVEDGRVFCGNYAGHAFAVRDKDGRELWNTDLGAKIVASPAPGKKHVFFATQSGAIFALDKKHGRIAWRYEAGGRLRATPLARGDDVFAPAGDGKLVCLEQKSGRERWVYDAGSTVLSSPTYDDGRLLFGCQDGSVRAVSSADGTPLWTLATHGAVQSTPAIDAGMVYVGSSDRHLYAIRAASGDVAWTFPTKAPILATPTVQDHKIYITAYDRCTYVIEAASGRQLARRRLDAPIYSSPLVAEGRIYCGSNDGTVYCMSDVRN